MRFALTAIAFVAVMLLSACADVHPYDPAAFAGWSLERAQAACNTGNPAACNAANNLRGDQYNRL